jgi:hypothetical protein
MRGCFSTGPILSWYPPLPATRLTPHDGMLADLRRDNEAMSGMIFGPIPDVDEVVAAIAELVQSINRGN